MLGSLLIVFREVMEAGLIIGIVLAATQGIAHRGRWVAGGIAAGVAGAAIVALFAGSLSQALSGNGQDVFSASILCVAVLMLGWHTIWMTRHGREMAGDMRALGAQVASGQRSLTAMAVVVAVAVLREGVEVVLFLYGIAVSTHSGPMVMLTGGMLGIVAGGAVSWLLYRGLIVIPLHRLFGVTGVLIAFLAAGMASQAAALLAGDDIIPACGYEMWDTSWLLSDGSMIGRAAKALFGYSDRPMGIQLIAWVITLGVMIVATRLVARRPSAARVTASS
ncbi:FTR1 family iron permease [Novacetimonas hansenii]|uniref:FTR1 family iron permease n=1 Tax=Novacetimonas hansenii TaxID=436 RepID=UPI000789BE91|nr:FTR1 family protein [Novacetimonas hansenii]RFP01248.1 iron permease [Novacetimonas hansenii]WEQ58418.1 FTR1 family protein [Novacetimonas hansenii]CUW48429.1 Ferrous iron permease EfeU [Novacetimonas hansenii]